MKEKGNENKKTSIVFYKHKNNLKDSPGKKMFFMEVQNINIASDSWLGFVSFGKLFTHIFIFIVQFNQNIPEKPFPTDVWVSFRWGEAQRDKITTGKTSKTQGYVPRDLSLGSLQQPGQCHSCALSSYFCVTHIYISSHRYVLPEALLLVCCLLCDSFGVKQALRSHCMFIQLSYVSCNVKSTTECTCPATRL